MLQPEKKKSSSLHFRKVGHLLSLALATGHSLAVMYGGFSPWWVIVGVVFAVVGFAAMES